LEALSRGAVFVRFVEQSAAACAVLRRNIDDLQFGAQTRVTAGRLPGILSRLADEESPFDLIFADPPYRRHDIPRLLVAESLRRLAGPDALIIVETAYGDDPAGGPWTICDRRRYGDTALSFMTASSKE
jgi:16S rRNA (guanine966-N2)-methyltransferase